MEWILENKEWLFSGVAIAIPLAIIGWFFSCRINKQTQKGGDQGESVNILLNFTQFFETRIEYRFQIFTAHSCDFLLPSYARLA